MDIDGWPASEYPNPNQVRTGALPRGRPGPTRAGAVVSVMVIYADPVIAAGLDAVLQQCGGFHIVPAPDCDSLVHEGIPADVVIADYETAMTLAQSAPHGARNLVVFTHYDSEAMICRALESGVRGYLLYGTGPRELSEAIASVCIGGVSLSPLVTARITNRIKGNPLTSREKAVLGQLMLGLSNKGIARSLNVRVGTVKTHVKSILGKLNAESRMAAVITAQRRGLLP